MSSESACGKASSSNEASGKEFSCDYCDSQFTTVNAKRRHERNFHPDKLEYSCPSCSDSFHTLSGKNNHHATVHGECIAGVESTCEYCDEIYRVQRAESEKSRFCSKDCLYSHRSEITGEEHEQYSQEVVECSNCGAEMNRHPYEIESHENLFCDMSCKGKWFSSEISGENHPSWKDNTATFTCSQCGCEYENETNQEERTRFCSQNCLTNWQSDNLSGENSVHWKGGYGHYYGPNWRAQREKALDRDEYTCQYCGEDMSGDGRNPDVHHIKRVGWFKERFDNPKWWKESNRLDNLICACRSCHKRWEGIPVRPQ